jgi:hypothetical protein
LERAFGVVGKILMSRIEWKLIDKIWTQNVRDSDFEVIHAAENSNNFHKTRFGRKNQLRMW